MNEALWIVKKNELCNAIKKVSDHYGGDDPNWLKSYCKDVLMEHKDNIQVALDCFWKLEAQLNYVKRTVLHGT